MRRLLVRTFLRFVCDWRRTTVAPNSRRVLLMAKGYQMKLSRKSVFRTFAPFAPAFISRPGARYWREFKKLTAFLEYASVALRN